MINFFKCVDNWEAEKDGFKKTSYTKSENHDLVMNSPNCINTDYLSHKNWDITVLGEWGKRKCACGDGAREQHSLLFLVGTQWMMSESEESKQDIEL